MSKFDFAAVIAASKGSVAEVNLNAKLSTSRETTIMHNRVVIVDFDGLNAKASDDIIGKYKNEASIDYIRVGNLPAEEAKTVIEALIKTVGVHVEASWAAITEALTGNAEFIGSCVKYLTDLLNGAQLAAVNSKFLVKEPFQPQFLLAQASIALSAGKTEDDYTKAMLDLLTAAEAGELTPEQKYAGILIPYLRKAKVEQAGQYGTLKLSAEGIEIEAKEGDEADAIKDLIGANDGVLNVAGTILGIVPTHEGKLIQADIFNITGNNAGKLELYGLFPVNAAGEPAMDEKDYVVVEEYKVVLNDDTTIVIGKEHLEASLLYEATWGVKSLKVGFKVTESTLKESAIGNVGDFVMLGDYYPVPGSIIELPRTKGISLRMIASNKQAATYENFADNATTKEAAILALDAKGINPVGGEETKHIFLLGEVEAAAFTGTGVVATPTKYEYSKVSCRRNKGSWSITTANGLVCLNAFNGLVPNFEIEFEAAKNFTTIDGETCELLIPTRFTVIPRKKK